MAQSVTFEHMLLADQIAEKTVNADGDQMELDLFARSTFSDADALTLAGPTDAEALALPFGVHSCLRFYPGKIRIYLGNKIR